jgi:type II secretory pathway pseudopilin PulG
VNQIGHPPELIEAAPADRVEVEPVTRDEEEARARDERIRRAAERGAILQRHLDRIHKSTWILSGVGAVLLVVVVVLMAVSVQISRGLSESRQIAQRLERLEQFESRITDRLDSFNVGVQSLIGKTNDAIYNVRDEVEQTAKAARDASADIKAVADQLQMRMNSMAWQGADGEDGQPPPSPVRRSVPRVSDGAPETPAALSSALQPPSTAFRRIVNADGSTTYQKVR